MLGKLKKILKKEEEPRLKKEKAARPGAKVKTTSAAQFLRKLEKAGKEGGSGNILGPEYSVRYGYSVEVGTKPEDFGMKSAKKRRR